MAAPVANDTYNVSINIPAGSTTSYYIESPTASGSDLEINVSDSEDDQIWAVGADVNNTTLLCNFTISGESSTTNFYMVADGTEGDDVTVTTDSGSATNFIINDDCSIQIYGTSGTDAMYLVPDGTTKVKQSKTKQTWTFTKKSLASSGPNHI